MKPILMFILESCPYCRQARDWMAELQQEYPEYSELNIEIVDERKHPDIAGRYDYYYVPTYYVNGEKLHEGVASREIVRKVFTAACERPAQ